MPSRRPVTVIRRGSVWYLRRAVPKEFRAVETRQTIWKALQATTRAAAEREAGRIWSGLLRKWRLASSGIAPAYFDALHNAKATLAREGLKYLPAKQVAKLPPEEFFARIDRVRRGPDGKPDARDAMLYLGGIETPAPTPTTLFDAFVHDLRHEPGPQYSQDQMRRLIAAHRQAVTLFIAAVGDVDLRQVTTEELVCFNDWLRDHGWRQSTINTKLYALQKVITRGTRALRLNMPFDLRDFAVRPGPVMSRPAFSTEWIVTRLLAPSALDGLDTQARLLLLGMVNTGYRPSEATNLRARDIRLDTTTPHISIEPHSHTLKSHNARRMIPLAGVSLWAFQQAPQGFGRWRDRPGLSSHINTFLTRANLRETPKHTLYGLRHAFEMRLVDAAIRGDLIAQLMGHASGRPIYARPLPAEMLLPAITRIALDFPQDPVSNNFRHDEQK